MSMMLPLQELLEVFISDFVLGHKPLDGLLLLLGILGSRLDLEQESVEVLLVLCKRVNISIHVKNQRPLSMHKPARR